MNLLDYVKMPTRHITEERSPPEILGRCGEAVCVLAIWCVESIGSAVLGLCCCQKRRLPSKRVWHRWARGRFCRVQTRPFFLNVFCGALQKRQQSVQGVSFSTSEMLMQRWASFGTKAFWWPRRIDVPEFMHNCVVQEAPVV